MILPFSTQLNGKPTHFVEKIFLGLKNGFTQEDNYKIEYELSEEEYTKEYKTDLIVFCSVKPKLHTIREDKNNRWKPGVMIDFFINARQKNMFRFAPRIPVVSTQKIEIFYFTDWPCVDQPAIYIDGKFLPYEQWLELAQNDGFDNIQDFFEYFNTDFSGKIIHWTDKRY